MFRGDGERIWVRVIGQPVLEDGRVVRVGGIVADVTDRRRAQEKIRTLNAELEQRVAARTAQLERANRELETFAYSVSHDLRAPLRAVNAFSQLLREECGEKLGEEGRHYLDRVHTGAVRMGELIDAVLELSRLSRRPMMRVQVDLSGLASEIVAELQTADRDRQVEVEIQDGLLAETDLALARSVLQNLLANAYKFTSHTLRARVRFGAVENNGVPAYYVADNGAGFDMAHAKQLFLPFHRLHQDSEFPGEGIGYRNARAQLPSARSKPDVAPADRSAIASEMTLDAFELDVRTSVVALRVSIAREPSRIAGVDPVSRRTFRRHRRHPGRRERPSVARPKARLRETPAHRPEKYRMQHATRTATVVYAPGAHSSVASAQRLDDECAHGREPRGPARITNSIRFTITNSIRFSST